MPKTGQRRCGGKDDLAAVIRPIVISVIVVSLALVVSCSGGGEGPGDTAEAPGTEAAPAPETGKDDTEVPKGDEDTVLRLTAKIRLTYLVNGAVEETEEGLIAVDGDRTRYETPRCKDLDYSHVTVDRGDLGLVYVIIPERRRYFEITREAGDGGNKKIPGSGSSDEKPPSGPGSIFGGSLEPFDAPANEVSRKRLGVEEVQGYACEKFRVTEEFLDGSVTRYTEWTAVELGGLPMKTEYRLRSGRDLYITRWELIGIKRGPPSPDLFTVPDGYVRVKDISEALKDGAP